jgi:hypothetical protein
MRKIELKIAFTDDNGTIREESHTVETTYEPDEAGEHRLVHILGTELKVMIGEQRQPTHNTTARRWLEFPGRSANISQFFDIHNSQALWFELATLVMGAEADLILAEAYKALEPPQEPPFEDDLGVNDLYYVHDRKMNLLNQSVQSLIKVQDLVNRLLHESLGGDLVDTTKQNWEKVRLKRENVEKQLESRRASGGISQADFEAITQALAIPDKAAGSSTAQSYRNRLMHHIRPSVDYAMFFSALESRDGEDMEDAQGNVIGRRHVLRARPPAQYRFQDLLTAYFQYLDAIVAMLVELSQIEILRR